MNRINPSRRHALGLMLGSAAALALPPAFAANSQRVVSYYGNPHLVLPQQIQRVGTTWEAQNSIIAMLGFGDRIVATTRTVKGMPVFRKFVPGIADAIIAGATMGEINIEALMQVHPEVLFVTGQIPEGRREQLEQAGIQVVTFRANSLQALIERTLITGEILGGGAVRKAQDYRDYINHNIARIKKGLEGISRERRLKVYHTMGTPLETMGRPSLVQDWMDASGAINVAEKWAPTNLHLVQVSIEQVLESDPDVIIVMFASQVETIRRDPVWSAFRAVKQNRVHANPRGMFWWSRETTEEALQILWVAKTLYPDAFNDINIERETRDFYARFYGYRLSDAEVNDFLHPKA